MCPTTGKGGEEAMKNRLRALRDRSRLTQAEVAKLLDIDITTVNKHESGARVPEAETLQRYARLYKVETHELFLEL